MRKNKVSTLGRKFNRRLIFSRFYIEREHDLKSTILIDGVGRSGTTWLAEILSIVLKYRIIFEPFNPRDVELFKDFDYKEYIPPDLRNDKYYAIFKKILSGKIRNKHVDQDNRVFLPKGRVVKSIRASFFLKWIKNNFPEIPIIFIIRHPCATTYSRSRLGWSENELELLLKQDSLINDHLKPYLSVIRNAESLIQKNACIWCIQNLLVSKTMETNDYCITTYEELYTNPELEIKKILRYIGIEKKVNAQRLKNRVSLQTFKNSMLITESNPLSAWKTKLKKEEITEILNIVSAFSLDSVYNDGIMPKKNLI